ncbi:hypothetical protein ACRAWG_28025 [Methylobacterium sp. P31]
MLDALACSIAQTAADVLGRRSNAHGGIVVLDEAIGAYLWFEHGFRDHDTLVQLINYTRRILDEKLPPRLAAPYRRPAQLSLDIEAA